MENPNVKPENIDSNRKLVFNKLIKAVLSGKYNNKQISKLMNQFYNRYYDKRLIKNDVESMFNQSKGIEEYLFSEW